MHAPFSDPVHLLAFADRNVYTCEESSIADDLFGAFERPCSMLVQRAPPYWLSTVTKNDRSVVFVVENSVAKRVLGLR